MNNLLTASDPKLRLRFATEDDAELILEFIRGLADYERLTHEVVADADALRDTLFGRRRVAEVLIAEYGDRPAGFALFFHNYSTFLAKPGLYLEDLFVIPALRGNGIGEAILRCLARIAVDRECGRLEWSVLDWNESAIRFYEKLGAKALDEWTMFRMTGDPLRRLAGE